jgi:ABC-2 type transport system permease protein
MTAPAVNWYGIAAIFRQEMARFGRSIVQSILTPVITTTLYFVVFGSAIGSRMNAVEGVDYGAFIVPGLIMLTILVESLTNGAFGIQMQKMSGTIYELLSAPISAVESVSAYVGAAALKSVILGLLILATATFFVRLDIQHPVWMLGFLVLTSLTFSLFGFILGALCRGWEQLWVVPGLVVTPLTFLGGAFYSIDMLPAGWRTVALFNPVVYLVSGFRWSFFGLSDVPVAVSLAATLGIFLVCLAIVSWIFKTGYKLKN